MFRDTVLFNVKPIFVSQHQRITSKQNELWDRGARFTITLKFFALHTGAFLSNQMRSRIDFSFVIT